MKWDIFLAPYSQAVDELKIKLKGMRKQFDYESRHSPIEFVTGRVKPITSIVDKAKRREIPIPKIEEEVQDIAGLRVVCPFVDDIYEVVDMIRARQDFDIVEEKDYIEKNKESGYRSYHVIISYPVETIHGEKRILAEVQIRTLAMNFWAINEHSLNYKYSGQMPSDVTQRLKNAAEAAFRLDEEMSKIRKEIRDAQEFFRRKKD
ncbi:GTP pyrophosphokinase [Alkalibacillus haloalkaliphilus]|uniref:GTP diphosphokinase n=1 Tax=Alkalibacillus haloalkaliphilus TaxID=94136 RepID=A0A511W8F1_9BACI|nr:GTP pyrophosphokinase family protein [Alkalibacillus haloalkaliphilus]MDV2582715.1 GTP pyrophosphokinase family protein [Alkalibacillus haloalkaliphilus]GEN45632.1 GTP pyrophosphokinase [Alkalibacillus haloalkaliphilus]